MTTITLKGQPIHTVGTLPAIHSKAPDFELTKTDLTDIKRQDFQGNTLLISAFPSVDTDVCATSVREFNAKASLLNDVVVLCVSADLPFALKRFCGAEGLTKVIPASTFRHPDFGRQYGLTIVDGPLAGLLSRAVIVINKEGNVTYTEQVPEIGQEPNYDKALAALK